MIYVFQGKAVKGLRVALLLSGTITWYWGGVQLPCWKDTQATLWRGPCMESSLLLTATLLSLETPDGLIKPSPADMTGNLKGKPRARPTQKTLPNSRSTETEIISLCYSKPLVLITYYTTIRYPISSCVSPASQYIHKYAQISSTEIQSK